MRLYGWKPLIVSHLLSTFNSRRACDSRDISYLTYDVNLFDHVFRELCDFMRGSHFITWLLKTAWSKSLVTLWKETPHCISPLCQVLRYQQVTIGYNKYYGSGYIMILVWRVILIGHVFMWSCDWGRNRSSYVTVLLSFLAIGILVLDM